jgi:hypothetical protein
MSVNTTAKLIVPVLQTFRPITLGEMDNVQLLNRMDTKFVFPVDKLLPFLEKIKDGYRLLETNPLRYADYNSLYYDTADSKLYFTHHRGKSGRYKIRFRSYNDTKMFFLEIKHKNNKGRTDKSRKRKELIEQTLTAESIAFINKKTTLDATQLEAKLQVEFSRLTFVNNEENERATIDFNLRFSRNGKEVTLPGIVIAEIKQSKFSVKSGAISALRELKIREDNMSKYCIGTALIYPHLKHNNFKPKLHTINKLQNDGITRNKAA